LSVDLSDALDLLNGLEEKCDKVRDPAAYVVVACRRISQGEGSDVTPQHTVPPPLPPPPPVAHKKGGSRDSSKGGSKGGGKGGGGTQAIGGGASKPKPSSRPPPPPPAVAPLHGSTSPQDGKLTFYGGGSGSSEPPSGSSEDEERLAKRIKWLNYNAGLSQPLDPVQVIPHLMGLPVRQAMEILKKLEETAGQVRGPSGWVIAQVRGPNRKRGAP